jgi:gliding motility-associated-like protein
VVPPFTVSSSFTVPTTAATGIMGMRVITSYNVAGASIAACGSYNYGETEDYLVKIQYVPNATGAGMYCSGDSVVLVGSAPGMSGEFTYLWIHPNGNTDTGAVLTIPNAQNNHSGTYKLCLLTYPCTAGSGPADTSGFRDVEIWISPTPGAPVVPPIITYCEGSPFDTLPVYGQNLQWYQTADKSTPIPAPVINTSVVGTQTYYVTQSLNGCEGPVAPVTIQVSPQAPAPTVLSPISYCQGEPSIPLQATGQNLLWYNVQTGGGGSSVTPIPETNAQGTFRWYVSQTIAGCESDRTEVEVRVNYRPNALITVSRDYVCQYDTLLIGYFGNADGDTNVDFKWEFPKGVEVLSGSGQGPYVLRFDSFGVKRIYLTPDNDGCIGPRTATDIEVRVSPVFSLDVQEDACADEIVNISVVQATMGIDAYNWDFSGGEVVYGAYPGGPFGVRWSNGGRKTVRAIGTAATCPSLPVMEEIDVHALPYAKIERDWNAQLCAGDSLRLWSAHYDPSYSYHWTPEPFFEPGHGVAEWGLMMHSKTVVLTVTDRYNCQAKDSIWIAAENCCTVTFPTAFTPNGDGKNDIFRMIGPGNQKLSVFRIVNRWGQTVFETLDANRGWDGTSGGVPQDMGVYHYYVKYLCADGQYYEHKGEVTLIR